MLEFLGSTSVTVAIMAKGCDGSHIACLGHIRDRGYDDNSHLLSQMGDALSVKTKGTTTMRMRQVLAAGVAAAAITVGGVAASGAPVLAGTSVERPFMLSTSGTITNEQPADCDLVFLGTGEPTLECDQWIDQTGNATHLGLSSSSATGVLTLYVARPCPGGIQYASTTQTTFVAANGDTLEATTSVTGCSDGVGLTEPQGTYSITDGTGRFLGAGGEGVVSSSVLGGAISSTWSGTLSY